MDRKEFLARVKEEAGLESIHQADRAVRVVVGIIKALVPGDVAESIAQSLPRDLREGWEAVDPYPADILEKEDIYLGQSQSGEPKTIPTITQG
ncbi:MAG: DUF2267 domain-containing protein [Candidatus Geothermincolales bacterium]